MEKIFNSPQAFTSLTSLKKKTQQPANFKALNFTGIQKADLISFKGSINAQSSLAKLETLAEKLSAGKDAQKLDTSGGYVEMTPQQAKACELLSAINAIKELAQAKGKNVTMPISSPIEKEADSSWMKKTSMYNLSPRAMGGLVNSIKLLPTVRPESIYLAPIFENSGGALYAQASFDLDPDIYKKDLEILNKGVPKEQQITADELMQAFVDAAHLLDKKVGIDIIPHVSDWADCLLEDPGLFRWVKLDKSRKGLEAGVDKDLTATLDAEIKDSVMKCVNGNPALASLRETAQNMTGSEIFKAIKKQFPELKDSIKNDVLGDLKSNKGFANLPVTPWNGPELPHYNGWVIKYEDKATKEPRIEFLTNKKEGNIGVELDVLHGGKIYKVKKEDRFSSVEEAVKKLNAEGCNILAQYPEFKSGGADPYGNLTPFKFYNNGPDGQIDPNSPNKKNIETFTNVFANARAKYGLDFLRGDMVKHSVDENNNENKGCPAYKLGYATQEVWKAVIDRARDESQPGGFKAVGAVGEVFTENMEPYSKMGFDLTIGNDQYWEPNPGENRGQKSPWTVKPEDLGKQWWQNNVQDRLEDAVMRIKMFADKAKGGTARAISQMFTLDTHDCATGPGNKHRIHKDAGANGVQLAMSLGLFASSGEARRPFYMINGNEDGSAFLNKYGTDLTITNDEMPLANDAGFNKKYHKIFNAYEGVKDILTDPGAETPKWQGGSWGASVFTVKSPAGNMIAAINEKRDGDNWANIDVPADFATDAPKGLIICDDKNVDVKKGETKKLARVIGKRMIANLPPTEAQIFRVLTPQSEAAWVKTIAEEVVALAANPNESNADIKASGKLIKQNDLLSCEFKPLDEVNGKANMAGALVEKAGKKYKITVELGDKSDFVVGPHLVKAVEVK